MNQKKYSRLITFVSILIPVVVAFLFQFKIDYELPVFLPPIYSFTNAITAILLIIAYVAIRKKNVKLHQALMKTSIALSLAFLIMYIAYHITTDPTPYNGQGAIKKIYYFILISHIVLSVVLIPMVLISYVRAFQKAFPSHRKIARITFPIWLYVTITGVVVYLMIAPSY